MGKLKSLNCAPYLFLSKRKKEIKKKKRERERERERDDVTVVELTADWCVEILYV